MIGAAKLECARPAIMSRADAIKPLCRAEDYGMGDAPRFSDLRRDIP
jgi:hypothetical protein